MGIHAFDPSRGWMVRDIELVTGGVGYEVRCIHGHISAKVIDYQGTRGLDYCWHLGGILHHTMESIGDTSSCVMDSVVGCTHLFISPSEFLTALVTRWIDRGADKFHELSWHVGRTWDCWMISPSQH